MPAIYIASNVSRKLP